MKLYRVFIPKKYNDGKIIPDEVIANILNSIEKKFGGYTVDPFGRMPSIGIWNDKKKRQRHIDEINVLEIFTEDTFDVQEWFNSQIGVWRQELEQEELIIIVQDAEIIISVKKSI